MTAAIDNVNAATAALQSGCAAFALHQGRFIL
jgi:hypothetical protein